MFGTKEYYTKEQEDVCTKNNLKTIIENIIGHPMEIIDKSFYIEEYKKQYNNKNLKYKKMNIKQRVKKTPEEIKICRHNNYIKYKEQKEKRLEQSRKHSKTEKGKASSQRGSIKRRARFKNIINTLTAKEWIDILKQYKFRCAYCGRKFNSFNKPTRDHIIPISKGGHNTKDNVIPACKSCNSKKGTKIIYKKTIFF